ncbi:ABC transporter ATP-binding protein [Microbacterium aquimaris]|uniref:ABC transporter ATP-binding protein n=1 Tax=Microbacterium aquimaris TaxID=459816 RepID=A0ABU5N4A0_9MICO|nr:ABC transporter ATP-binding protein [Microbacterium aquimaris]MDZ8160909.1 ABC transporter ATP-binding protein [Microbacterium aquimaris]|tara:strand:+ start:250 stop:996 length:747 start_codon:yes stop_codon:yes gene_type:complete
MTVNPEEPPIISFRDVGMSFGASPVFDGLDLDIRRGEFVSIIGPSGCGKSTVLRLGSGLTEPSSGSIDRSTDNVGYVFQDATLMPWRTVRRNVELLGKLDKMPDDELTRRVDAALETVGLAQYSHLLPRQLSGGMRMRASLARALVVEPDLFFFDEPFGALDEITRVRLNQELMSLFAERRFAGLFITHSVDESIFLSTKVLVMAARPGRVVASFDVPFAFPRPVDLKFTAEFAHLEQEVATALGEVS